MSLDERMRAGTRAAAGSQPIDTTTAWEEIQMQAQREHTRRNVVLVAAAAAAVVAGVVWGPGIVDSLSGQGNVAPVDSPTDEAVVDDGTDEQAPVYVVPRRSVVVCGGTALGDRAELNAIRRLFDDRQLPILTSNKWLLGHTLGAAGVLKTAKLSVSDFRPRDFASSIEIC